MKTEKQIFGQKGEVLAGEFYIRKGFNILETNYRHGRSEIDLIVQKGNNLIVFVEVKSRKNKNFGPPEDFVSKMQQDRLLKLADHYVHICNWEKQIRFDIISVSIDKNGKLKIKQFEDAFY